MAFRYLYINRISQFNETSFTILLDDLESIPPYSVRVDKVFDVQDDLIDDSFLYMEALKDIAIAQANREAIVPTADKENLE